MKTWTKGGKPLQVSRVPMTEPAWMWAPSDVARHRDTFWALAKAGRCVLLEFMNPAILGLVYDRGDISVLYSAAEIRSILRTKRQPADASLEAAIEEAEEQSYQTLVSTAWPSGTPVLEYE